MGQTDQSRIVADAAKARYCNVSMASQDPALLRRLLRAKDRMDAASEEDWPVERLANVSGVSEAHFARSFKEAFGVPPHRYLLTRRIGRVFRDVTGKSPSELRAREQASAHQLDQVPHCFVSAAYRPGLKIAVSEKRRRKAGDRTDPEETEVPK